MWYESSGVRYWSPGSLSSLGLASASNDGAVNVWDAATGTLQQTISFDSYVPTLSFDVTNSILIQTLVRLR